MARKDVAHTHNTAETKKPHMNVRRIDATIQDRTTTGLNFTNKATSQTGGIACSHGGGS